MELPHEIASREPGGSISIKRMVYFMEVGTLERNTRSEERQTETAPESCLFGRILHPDHLDHSSSLYIEF